MKTAWLLSLCCLMSHCVRAQNVERDEHSKREINISLSLPSTSDYLLEMAKSADVNLFADATDFLRDAPPMKGEWSGPPSWAENGKWRGALGNLFMLLAHEHWLTWRNLGAGKFLVWADKGDLREVGLEIAQGRGIQFEKPAGDAVARASLEEYLRQEHKWDGKSDDLDFKIPLSQLPAALRSTLLAARQSDVLRQGRYEHNVAVFRDEFWDTARLKVVQVQEFAATGVGKVTPKITDVFFLMLEGDITRPDGTTSMVTQELGRRDQPAGKGR